MKIEQKNKLLLLQTRIGNNGNVSIHVGHKKASLMRNLSSSRNMTSQKQQAIGWTFKSILERKRIWLLKWVHFRIQYNIKGTFRSLFCNEWCHQMFVISKHSFYLSCEHKSKTSKKHSFKTFDSQWRNFSFPFAKREVLFFMQTYKSNGIWGCSTNPSQKEILDQEQFFIVNEFWHFHWVNFRTFGLLESHEDSYISRTKRQTFQGIGTNFGLRTKDGGESNVRKFLWTLQGLRAPSGCHWSR